MSKAMALTSVKYEQRTIIIQQLSEQFDLQAGRRPLFLRLSLNAENPGAYPLEGNYLLLTGFYKLLHDLDVVSFRHSVDEEGLLLYLQVNESLSALKNYLTDLLRWHLLGPAWRIAVLADEWSLRPLLLFAGQEKISSEGMVLLANTHMTMGSRPLRFSRYFLYAALAPYLRTYTLGCAGLDQADARGERNFYQVLEGLDLMQQSLASLDLSASKDADSLRLSSKPIRSALDQIGPEKGFLTELLSDVLFLASAYEKKMALEEMAFYFTDAGFSSRPDHFARLLNDYLPFWLAERGEADCGPYFSFENDPIRAALTDLGLYILTKADPVESLAELKPAEAAEVRRMAQLALMGARSDCCRLEGFLREKKMVCQEVSDQMVMTLLLEKIANEEADEFSLQEFDKR